MTDNCDPQGDGQLGVQNPKEIFYNDVDPSLAPTAINELRNQSQNSFETPSGPPAWSEPYYDGRRAYLLYTKDNAIPPIGQEIMISNSKVPWDVHHIAASHSLFLSQSSVVASCIECEIANFQSVVSNSTNTSDSTVRANATLPLIISPAELNITLAAVS